MLRNVLMFLYVISTTSYIIPIHMSLPPISRRDAVSIVASSSLLLFTEQNQNNPICVIGASGQTGIECVKQLAKQHKMIKAISRKPIALQNMEDLDAYEKNYIKHYNLDIKNNEKLNDIIKDSSSVIFLANAKKYNKYVKPDIEEQTYEDVDVYGLQNVVKACIKNKIPRLVYTSASCRSCSLDESADTDKMSGIKCENCRSKQKGENIIRQHYNKVNNPSIGYTIVRVGFLINGIFNGDSRGVKELEINQDYTKSGMISKYDLAELCINAASNPNAACTTFEVYYADTAQPFDIEESLHKCTNLGKSVEECFFGSAYKNSKPQSLDEVRNAPIQGSIFSTGKEKRGINWQELFQDLQKD